MKVEKIKIEKQDLGYVGNNILEYLQTMKRYGHRGLTSQEIIFKFWGVISERAILKQLSRLKKWGLVKEVRLKYKNGKYVIFYEATN